MQISISPIGVEFFYDTQEQVIVAICTIDGKLIVLKSEKVKESE